MFNEYSTPTANTNPLTITAAADGNLWFIEGGTNTIGRSTTSGQITEYAVPSAFAYALGITAGPDGNVWFAETNTEKLGKLVP